MVKHLNGYTIKENEEGRFEIMSTGDTFIVQVEPTIELATLWTYAEIYRVMKEHYTE